MQSNYTMFREKCIANQGGYNLAFTVCVPLYEISTLELDIIRTHWFSCQGATRAPGRTQGDCALLGQNHIVCRALSFSNDLTVDGNGEDKLCVYRKLR